MKYSDIRRHLVSYDIYRRRKTTINHAFAAAVAPCDEYDIERIVEAIRQLGQNPDDDLACVYCDAPAETWDHVFATVKKSEFSGAGHRVGNLLPCCKPCNSKKGNKDWKKYIGERPIAQHDKDQRITKISSYLNTFYREDNLPTDIPEYAELKQIRNRILEDMQKADVLAARIRKQMKERS